MEIREKFTHFLIQRVTLKHESHQKLSKSRHEWLAFNRNFIMTIEFNSQRNMGHQHGRYDVMGKTRTKTTLIKGPQTDSLHVANEVKCYFRWLTPSYRELTRKLTHKQKSPHELLFSTKVFLALPRARSQINCSCVNKLTSDLRKR